jgi:DNA-binding Xre family transcriptional regulator
MVKKSIKPKNIFFPILSNICAYLSCESTHFIGVMSHLSELYGDR